jgi:hypothetical protein
VGFNDFVDIVWLILFITIYWWGGNAPLSPDILLSFATFGAGIRCFQLNPFQISVIVGSLE